LRRNNRKATAGSLILLVAIMLLAALSQAILVANAQTDVATVIMLPSIGGTTDPPAGTHEYANGTTFIFTATPDPGYTFQYWVVSGDYTPGHYNGTQTIIYDPDTGEIVGSFPKIPIPAAGIDSDTWTTNPANISHGFGYTYTYQAVFAPINAPTPSPSVNSNDTAIVIMQPSQGGTTDPPAGVHAYANGTNFILTATPDPGYTFQYWAVSGDNTPGHYNATQDLIYNPDTGELIASFPPLPPTNTDIDSLTFTTNPANVSHGYGYTFSYTAVFAKIPVATPSPSPATPAPTASPIPSPEPATDYTTVWIIAIVTVVIVIIIVIAAVKIPRKK